MNDLPNDTPPSGGWTPAAAEGDWTTQVQNIKIHLDKKVGKDTKRVIVDIIEVNGYIVSFRAIRDAEVPFVTGKWKAYQIGGSESSHISVSSAFSSP